MPIKGTLENLTGCANVVSAYHSHDGIFALEYEGSTVIDWNGQATARQDKERFHRRKRKAIQGEPTGYIEEP